MLRLTSDNPPGNTAASTANLALLGIQVAPSTVWELLKTEGIAPAPQRTIVTWADFLRH